MRASAADFRGLVGAFHGVSVSSRAGFESQARWSSVKRRELESRLCRGFEPGRPVV